MDVALLNYLKNLFKLMAAGAAAVATWYELRDRSQTSREREKTRAWYGQKWRLIHATRIFELPAIVIVWLINRRQTIGKATETLWWYAPSQLSLCMFISIPLLWGTGIFIISGWLLAVVSTLVVCILFCLAFVSVYSINRFTEDWNPPHIGFLVSFSIIWLVVGFVWLHIILKLPLVYATLVMGGILPIYILFLAFPLCILGLIVQGVKSKIDLEAWALFSHTVAVSFLLTLSFLLIGHIAAPCAWIPKTTQMLVSNVFCDGLTVLATLVILGSAIKGHPNLSGPIGSVFPYWVLPKLSIPIAIALDVLVASFLACASLWFGLLYTEHALSLHQVLNVLIGKSIDGSHFEIGPCFWVMHTTFLPTVFYLTLIIFCWIAKLLVIPLAKVLSKGEVVEKPHHLTAGVFLLIAAVFGVLAIVIGFFEETAGK